MSKATLKADADGVSAELIFKDAKGNLAAPSSVPAWSLSADGVVSMTVADDGLSAKFVPLGVGSVVVTAKAEGEPTPGEQVLLVTGDIEVVPANAETVEMVFKAPDAIEPSNL